MHYIAVYTEGRGARVLWAADYASAWHIARTQAKRTGTAYYVTSRRYGVLFYRVSPHGHIERIHYDTWRLP